MNRRIKKLIPPKQWQPVVAVALGAIVGLGLYIINVANVGSYLTDDPRACINCHVMTTEYITWNHSSHREVASCNDCHVPHENIAKKYFFKAKDGLYHATIYTLRKEPQSIVMHEPGQEVVQNNCIRCHSDQVTDSKRGSFIEDHLHSRLDRQCWECHRETPHGRVKSLAAVGYHIEPLDLDEKQHIFIPTWLEDATNSTNSKENEK